MKNDSNGANLGFENQLWAAVAEDYGELFEEKMKRLVTQLNEQFVESDKLKATIKKNLKGLGYEL